jgi:hypothetical protein
MGQPVQRFLEIPVMATGPAHKLVGFENNPEVLREIYQ